MAHRHAQRTQIGPLEGSPTRRSILFAFYGNIILDDLVVLKTAKMPAVLFVECGVIVNRDEELKLNDPARRARLIDAISRALQDFADGSIVGPKRPNRFLRRICFCVRRRLRSARARTINQFPYCFLTPPWSFMGLRQFRLD